MKINDEQFVTRGSKPIEESGFVIGDDAHLIKLLRDSLYSNPILAICREIASNARDAHREVGTPELPIRITIPNHLNESIVFQDFGPGISPERVYTVYRQIGNSTKRESNSETGGFGLGAKTPFAYTSSFIVDTISVITSQFDVDLLNKANETNLTLEDVKGQNLKCNYINALGGECGNNGSVRCFSAELTGEPTGTQVTIGVRPNDRMEFAEGVIESTKHWDVRPQIEGDKSLDWPEFSAAIISGERWSLNEKTGTFGQYAIVDGIEYPLKIREMIKKNRDLKHNKLLEALEQAHFYVRANTGDISLTPSREALQYNDHTIQYLMDILKDINSLLETKLQANIDACENYKDACVELKKFNDSIIRFNDAIYWKGNKVYHKSVGIWNALYEKIDKPIAKMYTYSWRYSIKVREEVLKRSTKGTEWDPLGSILICDKKSVSRNAVELFNSNYDGNIFYVIVTDDIDTIVQRIKNILEIDIFEIGSELLSKYVRKGSFKRKKRSHGLSSAWKLTGLKWGDQITIDRNNGNGFYVSLMNRKQVIKNDIGGDNIFHIRNLKAITDVLGISSELYGVRDDVIPKLGSGWVSLRSIFEKKKIELTNKYPPEYRNKLYIANKISYNIYNKTLIDVINSGVQNDDLKKFKELLENADKLQEEYENLNGLFSIFNIRFTEEENVNVEDHEIINQYKMIVEKYPMIGILNSWNLKSEDSEDTKKIIQEYLDNMELLKEAKEIEMREAI